MYTTHLIDRLRSGEFNGRGEFQVTFEPGTGEDCDFYDLDFVFVVILGAILYMRSVKKKASLNIPASSPSPVVAGTPVVAEPAHVQAQMTDITDVMAGAGGDNAYGNVER